MKNYGVILKKIRTDKNLNLKQAAKQINRGVGWLCEVENNKPRAAINEKEFNRIVEAYQATSELRRYQLWATAEQRSADKRVWFEGAIFKHLRTRSKLTSKKAAELIGISTGHLSNIESSRKKVSLELRNQILVAYGYKISGFRNYTTKRSRQQSICIESRLKILIKQLEKEKLEQIFEFAKGLQISA